MYVYHPGSQEDVVSSWEPAHSLVEDAISGTEIIACLSASGQGGAGMQLALHWYSLNPLFFEQARLLIRLLGWRLLQESSLFCTCG